MGTKRSFDNYMTMVGLNTLTKEVRVNKWCRDGEWPEQVRTNVSFVLLGLKVKSTPVIMTHILWI